MKHNKVVTGFIILMVIVSVVFSAGASAVNYNIKGVLKNGGNKVIYLSKDIYVAPGRKIALDSTVLKNDSLNFNGKVDHIDLYTIFIKGDNKYLILFLDGNDIFLTGDAAQINLTKISGPKEIDILKIFSRALNSYRINEENVFSKILAFDKDGQKDSVKYYSTRLHSIQAITYKTLDSLFRKYPFSFATIRYLNVYDKKILPDSSELAMLDKMPPKFKETEDYISLKNRLNARKSLIIGSAFKNFRLPDPFNHTIDTKIHSSYLIVDFWASWCIPCRNANPALKELYDRYKQKGLEIISVSIDENFDSWKNAIKADGLTWKQAIAKGGIKNPEILPFAVSEIPQTYLVDKDGVIVAKNLTIDELKQKMSSLYKDQ
jgi:thiol-disulfide isomerase/thioredoxin